MVNQIYLDNAATTKVDISVVETMKKYFLKSYGNPSSLHAIGQDAKKEIDSARKKIAKFIGAKESEIIFTGGGTESNNLAIYGLALAYPTKKHIISSVIEHPSVLETCKTLENEGYIVDYVGVDKGGVVSVDEISNLIRDDTLLVSVMHVNNEIGTIQPIEKIGKICREKKVYFHTDAVQSFKKLEIDVSQINIDLMSVSGHKIFGPKGVGFLYVREGVNLKPIIHGGGQEKNLRSGTLNVPGILGLATALDIKIDNENIEKVRNKMIEELLKISGTKINGSLTDRVCNNINVSFYGIEGESLMLMLSDFGIYVSTGSACSSTKLSESHVLKALGVEDLYVHGSLRISFGEILKEEELIYVVEKIKKSVNKLREMSPFKLNLEEITDE
ncbi:MAG: cysteine desulfurase family protein [archaeon]